MKIIGIDAGGSNTRVLLCKKEDLEIDAITRFREESLGPGNYRQLGMVGIRGLLREIISRFQIEEPGGTLVLGGFAGAGTPESRGEIESIFEEEGFLECNLTIASDAGLLLRALGDDGIVLIAGTGSICLGRKTLSDRDEIIEARAGGYGYRIASEAGGYSLGIRAIDISLKIADGRKQESTVLYQRIKDCLGLEDLQRVVRLLQPANEQAGAVKMKISELSKVVLRAAHEGDRVARLLVDQTVNELADHIQAVYNRLGSRKSVVGLHGGLFANPHSEELLIRPLKNHLDLGDFELKFETFGIRDGDRDGLIESMKKTFFR